MKNRVGIRKILLGLSLMSLHAIASGMTVQIFTDRHLPVNVQDVSKKIHVEYYNLGQLHFILKTINNAIKGDSKNKANDFATALIEKDKALINHAYQGIHYLHKYHVKAIPTIVFDGGKYRVIGQRNLAIAIQNYKTWLKK